MSKGGGGGGGGGGPGEGRPGLAITHQGLGGPVVLQVNLLLEGLGVPAELGGDGLPGCEEGEREDGG